MESDDYLQADFDPSTITVPRLRSILVTHNVPYQATAKKPQLVALFNEHVAPRAQRILAERARLRRTSKGFVDAPGAGEVDEVEYDSAPRTYAVPTPRQRSVRRSASPKKQSAPVRVKHEDEEPVVQATPIPTARARRSVSRPLISEFEDDHGRGARRSMRRTATPQIKYEEPEEEEEEDDDEEEEDTQTRPGTRDEANPFSSDNPFQAGSSPPETIKRRKSSAVPEVVRSRPSTSSSRVSTTGLPISSMFGTPRTGPAPVFAHAPSFPAPRSQEYRPSSDVPTDAESSFGGGYRVPSMSVSSQSGLTVSRSTQSFQVPVSQLTKKSQPKLAAPMTPEQMSPEPTSPEPTSPEPESEEENTIEPGEEFTPDEQLQLSQEIETSRKLARQRQKPKMRGKTRSALGRAVLAFAVVMFGAYLVWYRQEKIAAGYCGLGRSASRLISDEWPVPEWAVPIVEPQCQDCPSHAICYEDLVVRCETEFMLQSHPLSLGGIVPLAPTCQPDGARARKIKAVADKAVEELRERRAKWECGDLYDDYGKRETSPTIEVSKLKDTVANKRSKKVNAEEFEDLWAAALGEVKARDEVEQTVAPAPDTPDFPDTHLVSTSLASIPFVCAVKRSIRLSLARYRLPIGSVAAVVGLFMLARSRYRRHAAIAAQVPGVVNTVLSRLALQRELGNEGLDDGFVFQPHLRDDVLREIHSLSEREAIWSRVKTFVEQNSNVRTVQRESKNGDIGRAWEWIGPMADSATLHRRRSGWVSAYGGDAYGGGNVYGGDLKVEVKEEGADRVPQTERWQEAPPRPYY